MEYLELDEENSLKDMNYLNGRVDAVTINNLKFDNAVNTASEHQANIISRNLDSTEVSKLFFSLKNIDLLQQGIRNKILNVTNGKINISRQSDDELKIIMRSIYFQYGQNRNENIKDISTLPEPLERSVLPSKKGTKTLNITNMY